MTFRFRCVALLCCFCTPVFGGDGTTTWDGKYDTSQIEVTVVYFVPSDRQPLVDWKDRVDYFSNRIEQFHAREFQGQSKMTAQVYPKPFVSAATTSELREGDANAIYYRTLREVDKGLSFAEKKPNARPKAFPILLVLSDINWRPLDDFYRLHPDGDKLVFEGNYRDGEHFPGAASGGSRAAYLADRGVGWGLVSADGWRVPYRGTDCVIYHEGCGHTVGLPHPEPGNGSVMSQGQYRGWLSESWMDKDQKVRMQWEPDEVSHDLQTRLFTDFRAIPQPRVPKPGEAVALKLDWPDDIDVKTLRVRYQTAIHGPWTDVPQKWTGPAPSTATVATFERETPVSVRVDVELKSGETAELWNYFQVRNNPDQTLLPRVRGGDLAIESQWNPLADKVNGPTGLETDLLSLTTPDECWKNGEWTQVDGTLQSPKAYGSRLQLPWSPPDEYRVVLIVEPLDEPNGLLIGLISGRNRFATLFNYAAGGNAVSAIENIDGQNVGNESTHTGAVFQKNRLSQVIVTVRREGLSMAVDGKAIVSWKGAADRLSLSDYWNTPDESAMFLGAYDCRYRFHRVTVETISGKGRVLQEETGSPPEAE